jgi:hypothetical protein
VAVRSCHDSGKSYVASVAAAHHIATNRVGTARVVTTAPTSVQVKGILWVELNKLKQGDTVRVEANPGLSPLPALVEPLELPGRTNQTEWWIGTYLAGLGRKPSDYNPSGMQGLHAEHMLIIVDEAAGVTSNLVDAVETLATNDDAKILMIGNPDDPQSQFAKIHADPEKYGYHTIRISAWDTPNFTDEHKHLPKQITNSLLSQRWVRERQAAWGVTHPFYVAKVEAEFPTDAENTIAQTHSVVAARVPFAEREMGDDENPNVAQPFTPSRTAQPTRVSLGVDVAGSEHGDETVIREVLEYNNSRFAIGREWRLRTTEPSEIASRVTLAQTLTAATFIGVDTIGIGWGVHELIKTAMAVPNQSPKAKVIAVNAAKAADQKDLYYNKRAEMWWTVARELLGRNKIDTSNAENRDDLEAQFLGTKYTIQKGKILAEAKDDIRKRLGRSPDNADAALLAFSVLVEKHTLTLIQTPQTQIADRHTWNKQGPRTAQLKLVKQRA